MLTAAIVVAAGRGTRFGVDLPKQYQTLGSEPILTVTLRALLGHPGIGAIVTAIAPDADEMYRGAIADLDDPRLLPPVAGGGERADSVRAALQALASMATPPTRVMIHDAARPLISDAAIDRLLACEGGAILAEPVVDALWRADGSGLADLPVARAGLWRAQTPQIFPLDEIVAAHDAAANSKDPPALDDAEVFRRAGHPVTLVHGDPDMFKITTAPDLNRAERILRQHQEDDRMERFETRTGQGFDVHRFVPGEGVWLCGVHIPHTARLDGHSDADVGLHALADALYGALAEGDIGRHFPPSDPQWKGAESHIFLAHAAALVAERGGHIVNTDMTLLCEAPKIAPHADAMRARLAEIMGIDLDRISIKATTMERMGFVGREEGMGCMAIATIALPGKG